MVDELITALKFYADKNNYKTLSIPTVFGFVNSKPTISKDKGDMARKILEKFNLQ